MTHYRILRKQLLLVVCIMLTMVSCSQSGDDNEDPIIVQTSDDPETLPPGDNTDNSEDAIPTVSIIRRDNSRDLLARFLQIYSGQAYDSRYALWSAGQSMLGESLEDIDVDDMTYERYMCGNGGTLDHRSLNTGSRGGIAHGYIYSDCQIGDTLISGDGAYFAGTGVDNFSPDLVMDFADGSSLELGGLFQRHTTHPDHDSYDYWRGAASTYRYKSSDGTLESIESSTSYTQSIDCCESVLNRELSGDVTLTNALTGQQPISAAVTEPLLSSNAAAIVGFDQGQLTLSAEDGSSIVLNADRLEYGDMFQIQLNNDAGTEEWLESWADWESLLSIPSHFD